MTPDDIAKARALVDAATPGPWETSDWRSQRDTAFIAASRSLVPQLLDEVDRLTDALVRKDEDWQELFAELARLRPVYDAAKHWHSIDAEDGCAAYAVATEALDTAIDAAIAEESKP